MPLYCCAPGCKNSQSMEGLSFYRIPTDVERRRRWITAINRKNWQPSQYQRLCSDHFVGVVFNSCSGRTLAVFDSGDKRFHVDSDGTVKLKRPVTLHNGHKVFSVSAWDSRGKKHTTIVRVEHQSPAEQSPEQQEDVGAIEPVQSYPPSTLFLEFPASGGLRRRKRDWVIPPISISENKRGDYPMEVVQIKSSYAEETKMTYRITGEGADEPPLGIFTIDKYTGWLSATMPLDREKKDKYVLLAHAKSPFDQIGEDPIEVIVVVDDMNDNTPVFTQNPFLGSVPEASKIGFEFMTVSATDADDPKTDNADIRYSIRNQEPEPSSNMFTINPVSGVISVNAAGLDREKFKEYTLVIQAADYQGLGRSVTGKAVITVTDSNDNPPQFVENLYEVTVPENEVGPAVVRMPVEDMDDPHSSAWAAKFSIVKGDQSGFFNITTGPSKQEGIITTVKPLDFERNRKYTLLVAVENEVPFATPLPTSTATVIVNVLDVNEAPVFKPVEKLISKPEDAEIGSELTVFTATDPDTEKAQKVVYRVEKDPAGWLNVDRDTGLIKVKSPMDRESPFVKDDKYTAQIIAVDDDEISATGTGTLVIELVDVNDNAPTVEIRDINMCNKESPPVVLPVTDTDGPGFTSPFSVALQGDGKDNWTATMNASKTGIVLSLKAPLSPGVYSVVLRVFDIQGLSQDNIIQAEIRDCKGTDCACNPIRAAQLSIPGVVL